LSLEFSSSWGEPFFHVTMSFLLGPGAPPHRSQDPEMLPPFCQLSDPTALLPVPWLSSS
jgi:hypothetical protein